MSVDPDGEDQKNLRGVAMAWQKSKGVDMNRVPWGLTLCASGLSSHGAKLDRKEHRTS